MDPISPILVADSTELSALMPPTPSPQFDDLLSYLRMRADAVAQRFTERGERPPTIVNEIIEYLVMTDAQFLRVQFSNNAYIEISFPSDLMARVGGTSQRLTDFIVQGFRTAYYEACDDREMRRDESALGRIYRAALRTQATPELLEVIRREMEVARRHVERNHPPRGVTGPPPIAAQSAAYMRWSDIRDGSRSQWQSRDSAAHARAAALLEDHLSESQKSQYRSHRHFDVIGPQSGHIYRIRYGRQMNIDIYVRRSRMRRPLHLRGLCFLPEGNLVEEDCMLAQKIAIETDEARTLSIANEIDRQGTVQDYPE